MTGQLHVALDIFPHASAARMDWSRTPPERPTVLGTPYSLPDSLTRILTKLNTIPFDSIGTSARRILQSANEVMIKLGTDVVPQAHDTRLAALDSATDGLQKQNTGNAMREFSRMAKTVRVVAAYLGRHPAAVLQGKLEANLKRQTPRFPIIEGLTWIGENHEALVE